MSTGQVLFRLKPDAGVILTAYAEYGALHSDKALALEYGRDVPPNTYGRFFWTVPLSIVKIYLLQDEQVDEARALYEEFFPELLADASDVITRTNFLAAVDVAEILMRADDDERARQLLTKVESYIADVPRPGDFGHMVTDVRVHALRGDTDLAIQALRTAVDEKWRSHWRFFLDVDTVLEPLRSLPEFDSIYREVAADMAAQLEIVKAKETLETSCTSDLDL